MVEMNWSYVAAFFDGEGTIYFKKGCQWSLAQGKDRGLELFREIQSFLAIQGIRASIYESRRPDKVHTLYVTSREQVVKLLGFLFPYLRIKRVECQDVLRYIKIFPRRARGPILGMQIRETRQRNHGNAGERHAKARLTLTQVEEIRKALGEGTRCSDVARMYGVHYNTIAGIKHGKSWRYCARV